MVFLCSPHSLIPPDSPAPNPPLPDSPLASVSPSPCKPSFSASLVATMVPTYVSHPVLPPPTLQFHPPHRLLPSLTTGSHQSSQPPASPLLHSPPPLNPFWTPPGSSGLPGECWASSQAAFPAMLFLLPSPALFALPLMVTLLMSPGLHLLPHLVGHIQN